MSRGTRRQSLHASPKTPALILCVLHELISRLNLIARKKVFISLLHTRNLLILREIKIHAWEREIRRTYIRRERKGVSFGDKLQDVAGASRLGRAVTGTLSENVFFDTSKVSLLRTAPAVKPHARARARPYSAGRISARRKLSETSCFRYRGEYSNPVTRGKSCVAASGVAREFQTEA